MRTFDRAEFLNRLRRALALVLILGVAACEPVPEGGLDALDQPPPPLDEPTTTWLDLGRSYLAINDLRRAKKAFIRSLRVEGVEAPALTGAGITAERQGLLYEARRYFETAVDYAPNSQLAHNNLGAIRYKLGDYEGARLSFQRSFALSSGTNRVARHNLGLVELALKRQSEGEIPVTDNPVSLQREGTSEYKIMRADPAKKELDE